MKKLLSIFLLMFLLFSCCSKAEDEEDAVVPEDPKTKAHTMLMGKWMMTSFKHTEHEANSTTPDWPNSYGTTNLGADSFFEFPRTQVTESLRSSVNTDNYAMIDASSFTRYPNAGYRPYTVTIQELKPDHLIIFSKTDRPFGGTTVVEYEFKR
ncbi:hypothetical protein [Rufibacter hautae]|uniref:Lipocalin-like domain-containing protein n=1 Tax=Rufibacter hautae TaxID=2595005 RepID=A0A5B6TDF0_9BACT|nr:hypothetical protein [Rufibacter hautae]KAA3438487.1 hypothetical protein FOA19_14730 [Rufibacter hautae]